MRARILFACALFVGGLCDPAEAGGRWGEDYFPNDEVLTQDGEAVRFYDDLIKGKMVVISFIFTSCKDLCPINTARLAEVAQALGERMGKETFFLSISVDPENDTPERLKAFADAFYQGPGWTFITGDPATLKIIGEKLGNNGATPSEHRNEVVLGNDVTGEWSRNTPFGEIESLAVAVRDLDPDWRAEVRIPPAEYLKPEDYAHLQISREPGQALFKKLCSPCHTVGVGDRAGPDLLDVTERRSRSWLMSFIQDPDRLRRAGDLTAISLMMKFPGARMPAFGLSENDVEDLLSFLSTRSAEVETARREVAEQDRVAGHHHGGGRGRGRGRSHDHDHD